ncbi:MAG TPA: DUF3237 domain-containing protein [Steroidobacteraceae bacterium]|nr:DUF3237 domain-containing protein [Steroidobacteraceae bacterium]
MLIAQIELASAADSKAPSAPALEFVFEAHVAIDQPKVVGNGPQGLRRIVPITGGTFTGPKINGQIVPGGADWQFVRSDQVLQVEARYTLKTDDGVLIMITNRGMRHGPPEVIDRIARGEKVDPSLYYFRTVAEFEAPADSKYSWLNKAIFVSTAMREATMVHLRFYQVK